jgi:[protein-PII] uridylyltransferase
MRKNKKNLIENTDSLFDIENIRSLVLQTQNSKQIKGKKNNNRNEILSTLNNVIDSARTNAEKSLIEHGSGLRTARSISRFQDDLIKIIYEYVINCVCIPNDPKEEENLCLVAVGGYGRGTLAPFSDIDLLFLYPNKLTTWTESVIENILYILWDLGFKVGHATRNLQQCLKSSKSDFTIRTSILEARYILGRIELFNNLIHKFNEEIVAKTADEFIEMKLEERDQRHLTYGSSRYLVEPNIKESKGGLRDLHTLFWIGKYLYRPEKIEDLVKNHQFLTRTEFNRFAKAEDFLWVVRCHLHFISNRDNEILTFDKQLELASRLGYSTRDGQRDVERFMKHYFMTAKEVGNLTRIVCSSLEDRSIKSEPRLYKVLDNIFTLKKKNENFYTKKGRLYKKDEFDFHKNRIDLIRLFMISDQDNVLLSPQIIQSITRSLKYIDSSLRKNKSANRVLLDIFSKATNPEVTLRTMNDTGVLGKFLPEFGKVEGMSLFNLYHNFTVDEHLLKTVGQMNKIINGELEQPHPFNKDFSAKLKNKRVLLIAAFLHDIGKGRKQDHSIIGANIAEKVCLRLGMKKNEIEQVSWLIKYHLYMSDVAQKRDLYDIKTIVDFASIVKNQTNLDNLLALTVADIMSVGPNIWNAWKSGLLKTLYLQTTDYFNGENKSEQKSINAKFEAQDKFTEHVSDWPKKLINSYLARFSDSYWLTTSLEDQIRHAQILRDKDSKDISLEIFGAKNEQNNTTSITLIGPDYPNLLATLAGACLLLDANIVDAQIETTVDGIAIDTISVSREFNDQDEDRRIGKISQIIKDSLGGALSLDLELSKKKRNIQHEKTFKVRNKINITNELSHNSTVVEVEARDKPGLLFQITNILKETNINIKSAHIVTFGERANDVFYITNLFGEKIDSEEKLNRIRDLILRSLKEK